MESLSIPFTKKEMIIFTNVQFSDDNIEITDYQLYLFNNGTNHHSYKMLGAHSFLNNEELLVRFAVWAPNAKSVSVVGDFNDWNNNSHLMSKIKDSGVWVCIVPNIENGAVYKYCIEDISGEKNLKSDPYAFYSELRPETASKVWDLSGHNWRDNEWQDEKVQTSIFDKPINIYEVHAGSWKKHYDGNFLTYRELAEHLIPYVKDMGYTHIELMPLAEHPFDGSWGYQTTGCFSITSRYGTPQDFMYFVDECHLAGLGVILDWVPAHFPRDAHGLRRFDGTALYEHEDPKQGEHPDWGTLIYNYGRSEVVSFLVSNAIFLVDTFHIDGLRVDAVASMIYLDYGKPAGEWIPNRYGGRENIEAIEFVKKLNEAVYSYFPNTLMIAEESTSWPMVTMPPYLGGLGFNYKWNMGWMNDILKYMSTDSIHRKWHHYALTFSLVYAFSENFVLPFSHDEVVHGKKSLLNKMPGDYWQKFANLRLLLAFMMTHPGKKLLFMGSEFGQFIEWKYDSALDWFLLEYEMHAKLHKFTKLLNKFYLEQPALWEQDHSWSGFEWIDSGDYNNSVVSFLRKGYKESDFLIVVCNFTPIVRYDYRIGVPYPGKYEEILNTDNNEFGGSGQLNDILMSDDNVAWHKCAHSICMKLPPLAISVIRKCEE